MLMLIRKVHGPMVAGMNARALRLVAPVVLLSLPGLAGEPPARGVLTPGHGAARLVEVPWLDSAAPALALALGDDGDDADDEGPVVAWDVARVSLWVHQLVAVPPEHPEAPPELEPGVKVAVRLWPFLSVGAEYLATFGPVAQLSPLEEQSHRLFGALDFAWSRAGRRFGVNVALGYDVTGPEQWVGRLLLCMDLDRQPATP